MKAKIKYATYIIRSYPLSCLCILLIWILCLIPIPETPLSGVSMIDKWTHIVMFGGLSVLLWVEYGLHHHRIDRLRTLAGAVLMPLLLGGLVEMAQATCTGGNRNGDWLDFWADTIGVAMGTFIGILLARWLSRRNTDS